MWLLMIKIVARSVMVIVMVLMMFAIVSTVLIVIARVGMSRSFVLFGSLFGNQSPS